MCTCGRAAGQLVCTCGRAGGELVCTCGRAGGQLVCTCGRAAGQLVCTCGRAGGQLVCTCGRAGGQLVCTCGRTGRVDLWGDGGGGRRLGRRSRRIDRQCRLRDGVTAAAGVSRPLLLLLLLELLLVQLLHVLLVMLLLKLLNQHGLLRGQTDIHTRSELRQTETGQWCFSDTTIVT